MLGQRTDLPQGILELYGTKKGVFFLDQTAEVEKGVNLNQVQAVATFLEMVEDARREGRTIMAAVQGPMGGGKSNALIMVLEALAPGVQAFKHTLDVGRYGPELRSLGGKRGPARFYTKLTDIITQLGPEQVVLVDELQFDQGTAGEVAIVVGELRRKGHHALFGSLNFDFRCQPFGHAKELLELVDVTFVLAARCTFEGCGRPAPFTMRQINSEPAYFDDPVILVGAVSEEYFPRCPKHHIILPARLPIFLLPIE